MRYRVDNSNGSQYFITDAYQLENLINSKKITFDTIIYDEENSVLREIFDTPEYKAILSKSRSNSAVKTANVAPKKNRNKLVKSLTYLFCSIVNSFSYTMLFLANLYAITNTDLKSTMILSAKNVLLTAIIVMTLSFLVLKKLFHKSFLVVSLSFSIIFFMISLCQFSPISHKVITIAEDIKSNFPLLLDMKNEKNISPEQLQNAIASNPKGILSLMSLSGGINNILNANIPNEDISNILSVQTFSKIDNINNAQARIDNIQRIIDNYSNDLSNNTNILDKILDKKIDEIGLPPVVKYELSKQLSKTNSEESLANLKDSLAIEKDYMSQINSLLDFMKSRFGNYSISGDTLSFKSQSDINRYNEYMKEIVNSSKKLQKLQGNIGN